MTDGDADADSQVTEGTAADRDETDPGTSDGTASATETAPASDYTTGRRSISGRIRLIWGLRVVVLALVLGGIGTAVARVTERLPLVAGAVLAGLVLLLGLPWVHLRYRVWTYELREDALYLERGVVTHVKTIVPFVRIQHVDTQRGPFERALGLSTLVVYTAGSRGADVSIPGLTPDEARDLQRRVKELAIEAEGGDAV